MSGDSNRRLRRYSSFIFIINGAYIFRIAHNRAFLHTGHLDVLRIQILVLKTLESIAYDIEFPDFLVKIRKLLLWNSRQSSFRLPGHASELQHDQSDVDYQRDQCDRQS